MWIEAITLLKQLHFLLLLKYDTKIELPFCEEIMKVARLHKFMDFMTNVSVNMEMQMYGNILQNYLTYFL